MRPWQASDLCQRKIHSGIPFRVKRKSKKFKKLSKKLKHSKKVPKNGLTEPPFGEYMFIWLVRHPYCIPPKARSRLENPFWNSIRQIKIRCAKYKIAERSHNFLMQLPMQLIFGVSWDLDKLNNLTRFVHNKGLNPFWNSWYFRVKRKSWKFKKCKKLKHSKKVPKNGLTEPPFGEYMFIWFRVRTEIQKNTKGKIHSGIPFARLKIRCANLYTKLRNGVKMQFLHLFMDLNNMMPKENYLRVKRKSKKAKTSNQFWYFFPKNVVTSRPLEIISKFSFRHLVAKGKSILEFH